jgi:hypothetical protein
MSKNHIKDKRFFQNFESDLTFINSQKFRVGLFQPVAPIVSSYATTTVRELNDNSYSFI